MRIQRIGRVCIRCFSAAIGIALAVPAAAADGWAVGGNGVILKSSNLGESWTPKTSGSSALLNGSYFLNNTTGWVAGGQVILKTTNGGTTWTDKYTGAASFNAIHFADAMTGWAVGASGAIAKTIDGGENWAAQTSGVSVDLFGVFFTSTTTGYAVGGQVILKTTTGGTSWTDTYSGGAVLRSVYFADANTGWAVGSTGTILKTVNAGGVWTTQTSPVGTDLYSVFADSTSLAWIAAPLVILKTTTGGSTWVDNYTGGAALQSVFFLDSSTGWAVGTSGAIEKSIDGGGIWNPKSSGSSATLRSVFFVNCTDADGDGYYVQSGCGTAVDCDDASSQDHPGAIEIVANGDDENCDGLELCYRDNDGDGYGTSTTTTSSDLDCVDAGESTVSTDCDDASSQDHPGATEIVANGDDENCDGLELCYRDNDGDGYGTSTTTTSSDLDCVDAGESTVSTDCDDASSQDHPGATEIVANGDDENCDGLELCYRDNDGDGYGTSTTTTSSDLDCVDSGESSVNTDCDDTRAAVNPGEAEVCNGLDDNCNGTVDEDALGVDLDADGVANACDNCRTDWNPSQTDTDVDGEGDRCDLDDGVIYQYRNDVQSIAWQSESGFSSWNVYQGDLDLLRTTGVYTQPPGSNPLADRQCGLASSPAPDASEPAPGKVAFSLITGTSAGTESSLGEDSLGLTRPNSNPCPGPGPGPGVDGNFPSAVSSKYVLIDVLSDKTSSSASLSTSYVSEFSRTASVLQDDILIMQSQFSASHDATDGSVSNVYAYVACNGLRMSPYQIKSLKRAGNHHGSVWMSGFCHAVQSGTIAVDVMAKSTFTGDPVHENDQGYLYVLHYRRLVDLSTEATYWPSSTFSATKPDVDFKVHNPSCPYPQCCDVSTISVTPNIDDWIYVTSTAAVDQPIASIPMFGFRVDVNPVDCADPPAVSQESVSTENPTPSELFRISQHASFMFRASNANPAEIASRVYAKDGDNIPPLYDRYNLIASQTELEGIVFHKGTRQTTSWALKDVFRDYPASSLPLYPNLAQVDLMAPRTFTFTKPGLLHVKALATLDYSGSDVRSCFIRIGIKKGAGSETMSTVAGRYMKSPYRFHDFRSEYLYEVTSAGDYTVRPYIYCSPRTDQTAATILNSGSWTFVDQYEED